MSDELAGKKVGCLIDLEAFKAKVVEEVAEGVHAGQRAAA
jgi:hypothetical protein